MSVLVDMQKKNQELIVAMEQVQEGATTSTQGQHYVQ